MPGTRDVEIHDAWFHEAFGVREGDYKRVREDFEYGAGLLVCKANGKMFTAGVFRQPTLAQLRGDLEKAEQEGDTGYYTSGELTFENIVSDFFSLHQEEANAGAVFQVSSLFNCLETVDGLYPEDGVTHYGAKATQGAACSVACPAATVFRNYFVNVKGQAAGGRPIDCLEELAKVVDNAKNGYWVMKQGHCLPRVDGSIARLSHRFATDPELEDKAREAVQVGVHWDTQVWGAQHTVCQVFCSALPVGILHAVKASEWSSFAKVVLEAVYDATLTAAAKLAATRGKRVKVFLTAVGGGMLSNRVAWIASAMERALELHASEPLDVVMVHYSDPKPEFEYLEAGRMPVVPTPKFRKPPQTPSLGLTAKLRDLGMEEKPEEGLVAEIREAFAQYDQNGDGVLDRSEFSTMLSKVDSEFFTHHVINLLLSEADTDNDGRIYYHEFVHWICKEDEDIVKKLLAS